MKVKLITGPPGSGKSTLALERMRRGDVLLDMDRLWVALSGLEEFDKPGDLTPLVKAAWDGVVERLDGHWLRPPQMVRVVSSAATRNARMHVSQRIGNASLTVLEVPAHECLRRIAAQQRAGTTDWKALVEQWWREYQRPGDDEGWATVEVLR